jgi:hypothetical protein
MLPERIDNILQKRRYAAQNTFKYFRHLIYIKAVTLLNFYKVKIRNKHEVILFQLCLKYKTC